MVFRFKQGDRPLPDYTIQRGVGRGGFGEVYYATSDAGKEVALKFLMNNPEVELRGVRPCLNLKSPNLVSILDILQDADGDYFIVMEYIHGPSLRDLLSDSPNGLGLERAAFLLQGMGKGLKHLHDRGIVHRDLKPGNIFYEEGRVKIGDYGLAKLITSSRNSGQTSSVGSVHYMAPEIGSGDYNRTIDIYALGVILYEMLLGKVPFTGSSMGEILMKHLSQQPEVEALPRPLGDVVRQSLAKDPRDRFQTVEEMVEAVIDSEAVRDSLAGFDPTSLSVAARRVHLQPPPPAARPQLVLSPPALLAERSPRRGAAPAIRSARLQTALSPEAASGRLRYAGFWIRVVATIIDAIVVSAITAGVLALFGVSPQNNPLLLGVAILYDGLLIGRWHGQTLGKKTLGIKVISNDGRPCGEWQAFARSLAGRLNMFTLGFSYLMVPFSERKQGLHDRIASTLHVYALR